MKNGFKLPNMVLCGGDLDYLGDSISKRLSDQQMQNMADKISRNLTQDWSIIIDAIRDGYPEWFEVE